MWVEPHPALEAPYDATDIELRSCNGPGVDSGNRGRPRCYGLDRGASAVSCRGPAKADRCRQGVQAWRFAARYAGAAPRRDCSRRTALPDSPSESTMQRAHKEGHPLSRWPACKGRHRLSANRPGQIGFRFSAQADGELARNMDVCTRPAAMGASTNVG